jgi:acetyl esterase/lipase
MKIPIRIIALFCFSLLAFPLAFPNRDKVQAEQNLPGAQRDLTYGQAGGEKQLLDVYGAVPNQKRPAILLLHGGGWNSGSKDQMAQPAYALSTQGYVCFAVGYRLVKNEATRYPAQIDDVQRAVRWIRAHSNDFGVDPGKVGVIGFSAGGHLASLLGTLDTRDDSDAALAPYSSRVQCVVDVYGPADFTAGLDADPQTLAGLQGTPGGRLVSDFLGQLPAARQNYIDASPIKHIDKKTAPFLIFHGAKDDLVPVEQSVKFDAALREAGVESRLIVFPEAGHGYSEPALVKQTFEQSNAFFNRHLKG